MDLLLYKLCSQEWKQICYFSLWIFSLSVSIPLAVCLTWVVPHIFISLVIPGSNFSCRGNPAAPSTYSSSLVSLSSLLSVAELVNDCVLFIFFLRCGSFQWDHTHVWLSSYCIFISCPFAYLFAFFLPLFFFLSCFVAVCLCVFLFFSWHCRLPLLAVSRAVNCGHSRTVGGPSLLIQYSAILGGKLVCSVCLVWLFAFMQIEFKWSSGKLLVHQ